MFKSVAKFMVVGGAAVLSSEFVQTMDFYKTMKDTDTAKAATKQKAARIAAGGGGALVAAIIVHAVAGPLTPPKA